MLAACTWFQSSCTSSSSAVDSDGADINNNQHPATSHAALSSSHPRHRRVSSWSNSSSPRSSSVRAVMPSSSSSEHSSNGSRRSSSSSRAARRSPSPGARREMNHLEDLEHMELEEGRRRQWRSADDYSDAWSSVDYEWQADDDVDYEHDFGDGGDDDNDGINHQSFHNFSPIREPLAPGLLADISNRDGVHLRLIIDGEEDDEEDREENIEIRKMLVDAEELLEAQELIEAVNQANRVLERRPHCARAYECRSRARKAMKMYEAAYKDLTKALQLNDDITIAHMARLQCERGNIQLLMRDKEETALKDFYEAIALDSGLAEAYTGAGRCLWQLGQHQCSLQHLSKAITLSPDDTDARQALALVWEAMDDPHRALYEWGEIIVRHPRNAVAYFRRGLLHDRLKLSVDAIEDYSEALHIDPSMFDALVARAGVYVRSYDFQRALIDYAAALELKVSAELYLKRGVVYTSQARRCRGVRTKLRRYRRALSDFDRALDLGTAVNVMFRAQVLSHRSVVLLKMGQIPEALDDCNNALALAPHQVGALMNRARIYAKLNQLTKALDDYRRVLMMHPRHSRAEQKELEILRRLHLSSAASLGELLEMLDLRHYLCRFERQRIELDDLPSLTLLELRELVPDRQACARLNRCIQQRSTDRAVLEDQPLSPPEGHVPAILSAVNSSVSSWRRGSSDVIPIEYICPITRVPMIDPVVAADGHSYEKNALHCWFSASAGRYTSPLTNKTLPTCETLPNHALRCAIESFRKSFPQQFREAC